MIPSTASSSMITSSGSELTRAPFRSNKSQATPSSSLARRQCNHVDVEPRAIDNTCSTIETQHVAAKVLLLPGSETSEHLGREGFVELPEIDIAQPQMVSLQEFGRRQHRPEPHDGRVERRPFAIYDHRLRLETMFLHRVFGGDNQPRRAIGDLRAVAGRDLAPRTLEHRIQGCELVDRGIRPDAVVMIVKLAVAIECGFDFSSKPAFRLRAREAQMAFHRISIGGAPRDVEQMRP